MWTNRSSRSANLHFWQLHIETWNCFNLTQHSPWQSKTLKLPCDLDDPSQSLERWTLDFDSSNQRIKAFKLYSTFVIIILWKQTLAHWSADSCKRISTGSLDFPQGIVSPLGLTSMEDKNLKTCEQKQVQSNSKWSLCPAHTLPRSAYKAYICFKQDICQVSKKDTVCNQLPVSESQANECAKTKSKFGAASSITSWRLGSATSPEFASHKDPEGTTTPSSTNLEPENDLSFGRQGAICLSSGARPSHRSTSMDVLCMNGSMVGMNKY